MADRNLPRVHPSHPRPAHRRPAYRRLLTSSAAVLLGSSALIAPTAAQAAPPWWGSFEVQTLDGAGNNRANPTWGQVGTTYSRVAPARYADGVGAPAPGPNSRRVSNRTFNDSNQNLFSENGVTQWAFTWGQFLDHTFGLRQAPGVGDSPDPSSRNIDFDATDPLEEFDSDLDGIPFTRSSVAAGTGVTSPREQVNTVSSYIDAWTVYGGTNQRLEWLRDGPVDGNMANNAATLSLPGGLLPRRDSRGNAATAPAMDVDGRLRAQPNRAAVAGDVRANENIALTATHTLFAREHNRIVGLLPNTLTAEEKFQIARRVVIAEQQYVTYNEFLPSMGVTLPAYQGYNPSVNANLGNEFATVGYRAHSMIHGEIEIETEASRYTPAQLAALEAQGVESVVDGADIEFAVPLNVAFFNPDLVGQLQLGPLLRGIGLEAEYRNDEQIDNQLRSVLFRIPSSGNPACLDGPELPQCFDGVVDLGAIDVERGRDHGMPTYNQLRQAFGLAPRSSFAAVTGESSEAFPADPELTAGNEINDPDSMDFTALFDRAGNPIELGSEEAEALPTRGERRTPLAARLRALYGSVNNLDGFTGMVAEPHLPGRDFGELQLAMWTRQFQALRDGDRFFFGTDPGLSLIRSTYGIDFRRSLAQIISANTDIPASQLNDNVFLVEEPEPATCRVEYIVDSAWAGNFQARLRVVNLTDEPVVGWTMRWLFPSGQVPSQSWSGTFSRQGAAVSVRNLSWNAVIGANGGTADFGFVASRDNALNAEPASFLLNGTPCEVD
ncbi:MAG TPA: peroxidase family protein [Pilimelia sp.]|nr:peroxidase family protein [Pilimelia sp.]